MSIQYNTHRHMHKHTQTQNIHSSTAAENQTCEGQNGDDRVKILSGIGHVVLISYKQLL